jgi:flagellar biosynthesis/type III secretory pathway protein FliH
MPEAPYSKFGFDNEFFELDIASGLNGGRAKADGIEQVRAEAYAAGLNEGKNMATAEMAEMAKRLDTITEQLTQAQATWEERSVRQLLTLWHASFSRLLGQAAQHYPEQVFEQHLKSLLPLIRTGEELTLRLHPNARHFHEKLGLAHAHISGHNFRIIDDHGLLPSDCVVEWHGGGLEAKLQEHQKLIAELLASAGAPVQAPAPEAVPPVADTPAATPGLPATAASTAAPADPAKKRAAELLGDDELVDALK